MKVILGIDPGVSGAIAWVGVGPDGEPFLLDAQDMPTVQRRSGKSLKNFINMPALADMLRHPAIPTPAKCVIEQVGPMPGQGVTSMFNFGYAAGVAAMGAITVGLPLEFVRPQVWQRPFSIGGDKDKSRLIASQLFPSRADLFRRKKDNGRSDAALIATHELRKKGI